MPAGNRVSAMQLYRIAPLLSGAGQAAKTLLFDTVIELLTARAGGQITVEENL